MTFVFWNLNRKRLEAELAQLAHERSADVVVVCEAATEPTDMLRSLNGEGARYSYLASPVESRPHIFASFPSEFVTPLSESHTLTIRHFELPARESFLLAAVHLPSEMHFREQSQNIEASVIARRIGDAEERVGHQRTILVGDLNMQPFSPGVVGAGGFHAVMTRRLARTRVVQGEQYRSFYNPLWGRFGDASDGPPGTYFYRSSEHVAYFWHMFDQVLIRPELLDRFSADALEIVDQIGGTSLLNRRGIPDVTRFSDHLPLKFEITL